MAGGFSEYVGAAEASAFRCTRTFEVLLLRALVPHLGNVACLNGFRVLMWMPSSRHLSKLNSEQPKLHVGDILYSLVHFLLAILALSPSASSGPTGLTSSMQTSTFQTSLPNSGGRLLSESDRNSWSAPVCDTYGVDWSARHSRTVPHVPTKIVYRQNKLCLFLFFLSYKGGGGFSGNRP